MSDPKPSEFLYTYGTLKVLWVLRQLMK